MSKSQNVAIMIDSPYKLFHELTLEGLVVIETYSEWCGPCKAVEQLFATYNSQNLGKIRFVRITSSLVPWFRRFHGRSRPAFLFFFCGKLREIVVGCNYPRFEQIIPQYVNLDRHQPPEAFNPAEYFRELSSDPQFTKCYKQAIQEKEDAEIKKQQAMIKGLECDADPERSYNDIVLQFRDKWKPIKMFNDARLLEQIGDLRVDMAGEDNKAVFTGIYSNYGMLNRVTTVELLKNQLQFVQQVKQRKYDQNYIIAVFDYNQQIQTQLFDSLQKFYGEVVCQYQDMYFMFLIRNINSQTIEQLKLQFIYTDKLNILEDKNVVSKVFNLKISSKDEDEAFDPEFPTACFYFNHQDKLLEEHASAFAARQICVAKGCQVVKKVYETGIVDCRSQGFVGFKGTKLEYLTQAVIGKVKDIYQDGQAIAIICINPFNINIQLQIAEIQQQMKNKEVFYLVCFDEVNTVDDYKILADRYAIQGINVIQDIPNVQKPLWSSNKTKSYQIEPVKDRQYDIQSDLPLRERLNILSSLDKTESKQNHYILQIQFYFPERTEEYEVFSLHQLNTYIEQLKKNLDKLKLVSTEDLQPIAEIPAQPILQLNGEELIVFQRKFNIINKVNLNRMKYTIVVYLDQTNDEFISNLFSVYTMQIQYPECTFFVFIRSVFNQQNVDELTEKFYYAKLFNIFDYKRGFQKVLRQELDFDGAAFLIFDESGEVRTKSRFIFEIKNFIAKDSEAKQKTRTSVPEVVTIAEPYQFIIKGKVVKFCGPVKQITQEKRIVIAVLNQQEKDFVKFLHHYVAITKKHKTAYFITLIKGENDAAKLKQTYEESVHLNLAADHEGLAASFLQENGMQKTKAFYVYSDNQLDCCCGDLTRLQEIILDYTGTEWEKGFQFKNKQLQFISKSQLRATNQQYIVAFFENKEDNVQQLQKSLSEFYQKVQAAFPQVYFITCIQNISLKSAQFIEQLKQTIYCFDELNLVEDQDAFVQKILKAPIYNVNNNQTEDEDYDAIRSACFIYDENNNFKQAHANALDCRGYCSDIFNASCWPRSVQDAIIKIDEVEPQLQYMGQRVKIFNKATQFNAGKHILIHYLNISSDSETILQTLDQLAQLSSIYQMIALKNVKSQKEYQDLIQNQEELMQKLTNFNIVEDKISFPAPRIEMKQPTDPKSQKKEGDEEATQPKMYISSWYFDNEYQNQQAFTDMDSLITKLDEVEKLQSGIVLTENEIEDQQAYTEKISGLTAEEIQFRGQKHQYLNKTSTFQLPIRDDYYNENLQKTCLVLACFSTASANFEEQLFQFYKCTQQLTKLHAICLIKDSLQQSDFEKLKQKFSFIQKLNIINYKKGLFNKYSKVDGKFDQLYFVFNGVGNLLYKCNFVAELLEHARINAAIESFASDTKQKNINDIEKVGDKVSIKGQLFKFLNFVTQFEQQQGLVVGVFNTDNPNHKLQNIEVIKQFKELNKKSPTTFFIALCSSQDAFATIQDLKDCNVIENVSHTAEKLLKDQSKLFLIYRNNQFQTISNDLQKMKDVVDKFIETRGEAIKETIASIKQTDIKTEDGEGAEKKKKKSKVKKEI